MLPTAHKSAFDVEREAKPAPVLFDPELPFEPELPPLLLPPLLLPVPLLLPMVPTGASAAAKQVGMLMLLRLRSLSKMPQ
jgi:hypothetical protein